MQARLEQLERETGRVTAPARPAWVRRLAAAAAVAVLAGGTVALAWQHGLLGPGNNEEEQGGAPVNSRVVALAPERERDGVNLPERPALGQGTAEKSPAAGEAAAPKRQLGGKTNQPVAGTRPALSSGTRPEKAMGQVSRPERAEAEPGVAVAGLRQETAPETGPAPHARVFLGGTKHVRTIWLKLEVEDLEAARAAVAAAAARAGASRPRELWVYQEEEVILRAALPVGTAEQFLGEIAALGREVDRKRETADITAEFDRKMLEYQELAAKNDGESRAMAKALERQLEDLDRETLEAGREVVNVWLKLR